MTSPMQGSSYENYSKARDKQLGDNNVTLPSTSSNKRQKVSDTNSKSYIASALKKLDEISEKASKVQQDDVHDSFGKYVAASLRKLPPYYAICAESDIQSILSKKWELAYPVAEPAPRTLVPSGQKKPNCRRPGQSSAVRAIDQEVLAHSAKLKEVELWQEELHMVKLEEANHLAQKAKLEADLARESVKHQKRMFVMAKRHQEELELAGR